MTLIQMKEITKRNAPLISYTAKLEGQKQKITSKNMSEEVPPDNLQYLVIQHLNSVVRVG